MASGANRMILALPYTMDNILVNSCHTGSLPGAESALGEALLNKGSAWFAESPLYCLEKPRAC